MTTQTNLTTRSVVAGGPGLFSICRTCLRHFSVDKLGAVDCVCGAQYEVIFAVEERLSVKVKIATKNGDDLHYLANCPACRQDFGGGKPALGDRLCPHCHTPVHVEI